ncbi:MAG: hypothetical protein CME19_18190 [Gemmatimonadetes bacterium]|nr:hypothetical protein [Gemmatimonadota bacterium]
MPTSLQVDAFGFIKNDTSEDRDLLTKGPNTFRIFMLGGSTIAGIGAGTNENTISTHLERALNAASDGPTGLLRGHQCGRGRVSVYSRVDIPVIGD